MFATDDTIVAVATPPGHGGLGVVRLSGSDAHRIARRLIDRATPLTPRHATFARVVDVDREGAAVEAIDQVVVTAFERPHSYTGEDTVEISGHGSPVLLARIVRRAIDEGARLAGPGEFSLRAYLHGRIDLAQAEAVRDLVEAVTPLQARAAMDQPEGTLTDAIARVDDALLDLTARLEASLDFPDEGFHFITRETTVEEVRRVREALDALAAEGRQGRVIRDGAMVVITGPPNAGKSSLFNALVGAARAIVTPVPGTTRDVLTERVDVAGVPVTLVDTAGLREALDAVEAEGVARARQARTVAALTLVVLDGSQPIDDSAREAWTEAPEPRMLVLNKTDLPPQADVTEIGEGVAVSATTGEGLEALRQGLVDRLGAVPEHDRREAPSISNVRHLTLVDQARAALARAAAAVGAGATEELALVELTAARQALEELTGRRSTDDLLEHIFSRFCVGK
jgi:tRNA modification GTPase